VLSLLRFPGRRKDARPITQARLKEAMRAESYADNLLGELYDDLASGAEVEPGELGL